jgi:hypothetical protein
MNPVVKKYQDGMDEIIGKYPHVPFGELNYVFKYGILYQRDMTISVSYDEGYFQHYVELEDSEIAIKLNKGRVALSHKYCDCLLDIGIGSGEFIMKSTAKMYGFDINPVGVVWLKNRYLWADPYDNIPADVEGITLWDTMEHIPEPTKLMKQVRSGMYVFISLPIVENLMKVRQSKHFKENEHYYYWSVPGMIAYMNDVGFDFVEISDHETTVGRENILSFVFIKR